MEPLDAKPLDAVVSTRYSGMPSKVLQLEVCQRGTIAVYARLQVGIHAVWHSNSRAGRVSPALRHLKLMPAILRCCSRAQDIMTSAYWPQTFTLMS